MNGRTFLLYPLAGHSGLWWWESFIWNLFPCCYRELFWSWSDGQIHEPGRGQCQVNTHSLVMVDMAVYLFWLASDSSPAYPRPDWLQTMPSQRVRPKCCFGLQESMASHMEPGYLTHERLGCRHGAEKLILADWFHRMLWCWYHIHVWEPALCRLEMETPRANLLLYARLLDF